MWWFQIFLEFPPHVFFKWVAQMASKVSKRKHNQKSIWKFPAQSLWWKPLNAQGKSSSFSRPRLCLRKHHYLRTSIKWRPLRLVWNKTRWWFQIFNFHPYLEKWSNLTNMFQLGWNHQLENYAPLNGACCLFKILDVFFEVLFYGLYSGTIAINVPFGTILNNQIRGCCLGNVAWAMVVGYGQQDCSQPKPAGLGASVERAPCCGGSAPPSFCCKCYKTCNYDTLQLHTASRLWWVAGLSCTHQLLAGCQNTNPTPVPHRRELQWPGCEEVGHHPGSSIRASQGCISAGTTERFHAHFRWTIGFFYFYFIRFLQFLYSYETYN